MDAVAFPDIDYSTLTEEDVMPLVEVLVETFGKEECKRAFAPYYVPDWPTEYVNRKTGNVYEPHHDDEASVVFSDTPRHVLIKGGEGGGKTVAGIVKVLERVRRGMSGVVGSPDFAHFRRSLSLSPPSFSVRISRESKVSWALLQYSVCFSVSILQLYSYYIHRNSANSKKSLLSALLALPRLHPNGSPDRLVSGQALSEHGRWGLSFYLFLCENSWMRRQDPL